MDAYPGDLIVIEGHHVGEGRRKGEILEVLGVERPHYRVRWEDGHESLFYPEAGNATIERRTSRKRALTREP